MRSLFGMRPVGIRHNFGEAGLWITWERAGWVHETRLVPGETESVAYSIVRPRSVNAIPRSAQPTRNKMEREALEVVRKLWDQCDRASTRFPLELAGFTAKNLFAARRPRANPRLPPLLLAAVSVLWEECPSRSELSAQLAIGRLEQAIKKWVYLAGDRGFLDGPGHGRRGGTATDDARRLVEEDGREPAVIVTAWWVRRTLT
jgi:hypothetical protein